MSFNSFGTPPPHPANIGTGDVVGRCGAQVAAIWRNPTRVMLAALRQRLKGWRPAGNWNLGRYGFAVNVLAPSSPRLRGHETAVLTLDRYGHLFPAISGLNIRIPNAAARELIRQLALGPTRDCQQGGAPKGPKRKVPNLMPRDASCMRPTAGRSRPGAGPASPLPRRRTH